MNKNYCILRTLFKLCLTLLFACVAGHSPLVFAADAHDLRYFIKIPLTAEERAWLAQHPVIRVGVRHSWKPVEFLSEGNQFRGITIDYLRHLEASLGVKFEKYDLQDDATSESVDMLSSVYNLESSYGTGFIVLKPFLEFRYGIYTYKGNRHGAGVYDLSNKRIAVFKYNPLIQHLKLQYPDSKLLKVDLIEEGFYALEQKNVDAYVGNELVVDYETSMHGINYITKVGYYPKTSKLSMAVRSDWPILIGILNKSLDAIQPQQKTILAAWSGSQSNDHNFYLFGSIIIFSLMVGIMLAQELKLKRELKAKEKQAQDLVWRQANYDHLTNLPNRAMFNKLLEEEIKKAQKNNSRLGLLFLDMDHFKQINDRYGHWVGDQLLTNIAHRIQHSLREQDVAARLAGDEFIILLRDINDVKTIQKVANRIINQFEKSFRIGIRSLDISVSIGGALFPDDAGTQLEMMQYADQAMYKAKHNGRNQLQMFTPCMRQADTLRSNIGQDLRQSVKNNQLVLYYQPVVALDTKKVIKAEALLRWQHPEMGLIGPQTFIPIAEEIGMIQIIGQWVFEQALRDLKKLRKQFGEDFEISINVSPKQFSTGGKLLKWPQQLAKAKINSGLNVEITEGALLDSSDMVTHTLGLLRAAGMRVLIDDFGTGYSALSYLKKFDIDYLKLDAAFVRQIEMSSDDVVLCESIIQLAHKLNIRVIAEAIENEQQREILRNLNCDFGQGYLFAHPKPLQELLST